jgi:hypothetical protein
VENEIHQQRLDLTALHNHLIGETPKIMFLHLSGRGTAADLARKVKAVLARPATPTGPKPKEAEKEKPDWSAITSVLNGVFAEGTGTCPAFRACRLGRQGRTLTMQGKPSRRPGK